MKHIIALLIENEPGALSRVVALFSARGYNIESLTVAPTEDASLSRMTIVTTGSDEVIEQINKQLNKLVDVVRVVDLSEGDHIERELALFKLRVADGDAGKLAIVLEQFDARVLSDTQDQYTVEVVGGSQEIDRFLTRVAGITDVITLVRSGAMAVSRGTSALERG